LLWLPTRENPDPELRLTISLDVESDGRLVEMISPGISLDDPPAYSQIVIPMSEVTGPTTISMR